jgi:nitrate reductase delta subunit
LNVQTALQRLFGLFAQFLDYPQSSLSEGLRECQALLSAQNPASGELFGEFFRFADKMPLGRLQEVYTHTFDLDAAYHPYIGYHLFGESYKRSAFLVGLKERYRESAFTPPENQLPDHLPAALRFLAACGDENTSGELIQEALLPALAKMLKREGEKAGEFDEQGEAPGSGSREERQVPPYVKLLEALRLVLQRQHSIEKAVMSHV